MVLLYCGFLSITRNTAIRYTIMQPSNCHDTCRNKRVKLDEIIKEVRSLKTLYEI